MKMIGRKSTIAMRAAMLLVTVVITTTAWAQRTPTGTLEVVGGIHGSIHVKGWCEDLDSPSTPLTVQVYVKDNNNQPVAGYDPIELTANQLRNGEDNQLHYNGYETYLFIATAGTYKVDVIHVDATGDGSIEIHRSNIQVSAPYTVTYNANGGSGAPAQQLKGENIDLTLSTTQPSNGSNGFICWNTASNGGGTSYLSGGTYSGNSNVTLYAMWAASFIPGSGTQADPYLITSTEQWNLFASNVTNGNTYNGKWVKLGADITVSTMAGKTTYPRTSNGAFKGTFDGGGHTLNLAIDATDAHYTILDVDNSTIAPFRSVDGATFIDLNLTGYVRINKFPGFSVALGGLVGEVMEGCNVRILNCRSSVDVSLTSNNNYGNTGGFIGTNAGTATLNNCLFDGSLAGRGQFVGGIVGRQTPGTMTISNCLVNGDGSGLTGNADVRITFGEVPNPSWGGGPLTMTNCYYTTAIGTAQGTQTSNTGEALRAQLGSGWIVSSGQVVPGPVARYTITVDDNIAHGAYASSDAISLPGETITITAVPDQGYYGASVTYNDGTDHNLTPDYNKCSFTMPAANVTVTGTMLVSTVYTITYDLAGGSVAGTNPTTYTSQSHPFTLVNPTRDGYVFAGWTGTGISGTSLSVTVPHGSSGNRTYTATWTPICTITYNLNNGTLPAPNPTSYSAMSDDITLVAPIRSGYIFAGWTGTGLSQATVNVVIPHGSTGDRTYTATWTSTNYTISYDLGGGSVSPSNPTSYTLTTPTFTLNNPTRSGYTFKGWTGADIDGQAMTVTIPMGSVGNRSYTAVWSRDGNTAYQAYNTNTNQFETRYADNPNVVGTGSTSWGNNGETWYIVNSNVTVDDRITVNGTVNLILCNNCTLTANNGIRVNNGKTLNIYSQNGGTSGAIVANHASGDNAGIGANANEPIGTIRIHGGTITAQGGSWSAGIGGGTNGGGGTIAIYGGDVKGNRGYGNNGAAGIGYGSSGSGVNVIIAEGVKMVSSSATSNYAYSSRSSLMGSACMRFVPCTSHSNKNGRCKWCNKRMNLTVTYNANNATSGSVPTDATQYTNAGTGTATVLGNTGNLQRTGFVFARWNTKADGSGTSYSAGETFNVYHDITLYAYWAEIYPISYNLDGGSVATANPTGYHLFSDNITLNNPTREGYTFDGWTGSNGNTPQLTTTIPAGTVGALTYTANWTKKELNLAGDADNNAAISAVNGLLYAVTLNGYTLHHDDSWNTLVLPFNLSSFSGTPLEGATVKTLASSVFNNGELTLFFADATTIEAGKPYIVKWDGGSNIVTPTFNSVTVSNASANVITEHVRFIGSYAPFSNNNYILDAHNPNGNAMHAALFPDRTGYTLTNCYTDAAHENVATSIPFTSDGTVTLYPQWDFIHYPITYTLNGGSVATDNPTSYTCADNNITLVNPTREGYYFVGWTGSNGNTPQTTVTIPAGSTGDREYTAHWAPTVYTITYNLDGGSANNPATYTIEDATFTLTNPTRSGYTFTGWTGTDLDEASNEVSIANNSIGNRVYTATWSIITYSISYDLNGGSLEGENPATFTVEDGNITLINPTRDGYYFVGWTGSNVSTPQINLTIPHGSINNRNYTANWTLIYTISYDGLEDDGTFPSPYPTSYTELSAYTLVNPVRELYDFAGWTGPGLTEPTMTVTIPEGSTGNRTYTATWSLKEGIYISYNTETGEYETHAVDNPIHLANETAVLGTSGNETWYLVNGSTNASGRITVSGTVNLILADDASFRVERGITVHSGNTLNIYGQSAGTGALNATAYSENQAVIGTENNSGGTKDLGTITIHGGNISAVNSTDWSAGIGGGVGCGGGSIAIYGGTVSASASSNPDYGLQEAIGRGSSGQNVSKTLVDGLRVYVGNNTTPVNYGNRINSLGNKIARVEPCTEHNWDNGHCTYCNAYQYHQITYNGNGNTGGTAPAVATFNVTIGITKAIGTIANAGTLERTGYRFTGWNTTADGSGTTDAPGDTIMLTSSITLYAQWSPIEYTITYDLAGGYAPTLPNPTTYTIESGDITLNNPTRVDIDQQNGTTTNYLFMGWTGTDLDEAATEVTIPHGSTGNRTYTATWDVNDIPFEGIEVDHDYEQTEVGRYYIKMPVPEHESEEPQFLGYEVDTNYIWDEGYENIIGFELDSNEYWDIVTIPAEESPKIVNIPGWFTTSFKVYDDGGMEENAHYNPSESHITTLILNAPEGKVFNVQGIMDIGTWYEESDWLKVYDGADTDNEIQCVFNSDYEISPFITSTNSIRFDLHKEYEHYPSNFDLTVRLTNAPTNITLANDDSQLEQKNASVIEANDGEFANVTIDGRTLYRDGTWNTICLPFDIENIGKTPLKGAVVKALESSTLSDGTLTLSFGDNLTALEAGKPYIAKFNDVPSYIVTDGSTDGGTLDEDLVDGNRNSDWWSDGGNGSFCVFEADGIMAVTGYTLTTGESVTNPTEWKLEGKLNVEDEWTLIDHRDVDDTPSDELPSTENTDKTYSVAYPGSYRYFRFTVIQTEEYPRLAELTLQGTYTADTPMGNLVNPTFSNVTIKNELHPFTSNGVTFGGSYSTLASTDGNMLDVHNANGDAFHAVLTTPALPSAPVGYSYGWYSDAAGTTPTTTIPFDTTSGNVTLYAVAHPIEYTITYNGVEGATFASDNPDTYTVESETIILNNPTREGYIFIGWYNNAEMTGNAVTAIAHGSTGNKVFYAKWQQQLTITITAASNTRVYNGEALTANNYTSVGLEEGHSITNVTFSGSQTNVGSSDNVPSAAVIVDANNEDVTSYYVITYESGTLTVTPKAVTVTADDLSKTYGDVEPLLTTTVVGLIVEDAVSYSIGREAGQNIGNYTITPTGDAIQGNYTVNFVSGTLTINPALVTVTADTKTKTYGDDDPQLTATVEGIIIGESEDLISYSLSRAAGENVGDYTITASGEAAQGNYTVSFVPGTLTIESASVTVTAEAKSKRYGAVDPAFTATVSGLLNDDPTSIISYSFDRDAGEDVGEYIIIPTGDDVQGNYDVTYVPAFLTINPMHVDVTITGNNSTIEYDGTEHTVVGYEVTSVSTVEYPVDDIVVERGDTATRTNAGTTNMGLTANLFHNTSDNYDVTFTVIDGYLTISPASATVTITGNSSTDTYDGTEHSISGYEVSISPDLYTESDFTFSGTASAARTDAGTTSMGLSASDFTNTNDNFGDVTFNVTDGYQTVTAKVVDNPTIELSQTVYDYDGTAHTPTVIVKDGGTVIPAAEYSVDYSNNVNAGTATVTVTDNTGGNYTVSGSTTFLINAVVTLDMAVAGGWQAISTPVHDIGQTYESISNVDGLTDGSYDMFRYDEKTATWKNQKAGSDAAGFDRMQPARGYIYRSSDTRTLTFVGQPNSNATYSDTLTATAAAGDLEGFNLVGNPYPYKVLLNRAFYSLNADGTWQAHLDGDSLEVGQGALVHTTTNGEILTFYASTRSTNPGAKGYLPPLSKGLCLSEDCGDTPLPPSRGDEGRGDFARWDGDQLVITGTGTLQAFDVMGRLLLRREMKNNEELRMKNEEFPGTGVYILRLNGQSQKIVIK